MIDFNNYLACSNGNALDFLRAKNGEEWLENTDHSVSMIALLDGSDLFAQYHGEILAVRKEDIHYRTCRRMILSFGGHLVDRDPGHSFYRDAVLASFDGLDAIYNALSAALETYRFLANWNAEHGLGWEEQVHSRVGISRSSWQTTLLLARQAERQEIILCENEWEQLSQREKQILSAAVNIRSGCDFETWSSLFLADQRDLWDNSPTVNITIRKTISAITNGNDKKDKPDCSEKIGFMYG